MSESQIIDPAAHERLLEWGGAKLLKQMLRLFLENSGERMTQIQKGLDGRLPREVEIGAHSLKSSAANVGASTVSRLAAEMEDKAAVGDLDGAAELHDQLVAAQEKALGALRTIEGGLIE